MRAARVVESPELHEVRVRLDDLVAGRPQLGDQPVPLGLQLLDVLEQHVGVLQGGQRGRLGDGRQVIRQAYELDGVHDRRVRREIAQAQAGGAEGLRHRPGDDEIRPTFEQRQQRVAVAELDVRLVDDDHRRLGGLRGVVQRQDRLARDRVARGVVGGGDEDDVGPVLGDRLLGGRDVDREVVVAGAGDPAGAGAARDEAVHRVRRLEADRRTARSAEGLQQLLDDLVGAVGRPHVGQGDLVAGGVRQVLRELRAQLHGVPVRVAVEVPGRLTHPLGDPLDQRLGQGVGVLVGVQPYGDVQLGRAVRGLAAQLVPHGEIVDAYVAHLLSGTFQPRDICSSPTNLALIAAPCAGRSSASASVTTCCATSASASFV